MKTNLLAKKVLSALAVAAAVVATGLVRADEVAVGTGETHTFTNASDRVQSEAVRLADRATLVQLGTGTTTLQTGTFVENTASASLAVRAGTVRLTASEPSVTSYPEPTDVLAKAAFWVDAANAASLAMREGTTDEVETWRDARETGDGTDGSPYAYTRAVAFTNDWLTAFPQLKALNGKTGVWFRGGGSGCFMNWLKPDGTQQTLTGIRHVFVVHAGDDKGIGDFLGQRLNATAYFERVGSGGYGYSLPMWPTLMNGSLGASRVYLNGEEVDKYTTYYSPSTVYTVEVEALNESLGAMCFFNDRDMQVTATDGTNATNADGQMINVILGNTSWTIGGDRAGGGYLFEVVVFTNDLTAAERLAVSDWLNQKWRDVLPPSGAPKLAVSVASGAAVEIGAGALAAGSPVTGDGTLVKTGDDALVLPTAAEPHNASLRLDVRGGSVRLDGDVPLVCRAGDTLVSERGLDGVAVSAPTAGADATRLVKSGSGPVTLDAVPDGVTRIDVTAGELRFADPEAASGILPTAAETVEVAFPDPGFETYRGTSHSWAFYNLPTDGTTLYGWGAAKTKDGGDFAAFYDQDDHSVDYFGMTLQSPPSGVLFVKGNAYSAWCEIEVPSDGEYELSCRAAPRNSDYLGTHMEFVVGDTLADALADDGARVSFGALTTTEDKWKTFRLGRQRLTKGTKVFCLKNVSTASDPGTQFDDFRLVRVSDVGLWELPNGGFEARTASFNANSFCLANAACVANYAITQAEGSSDDIPTTFAPKGVKDGDKYRFNQPWNRADSETQLFMSGAGCTLTTTFTPPAGTWWFRADFSDCGGNGYKIAASAAIGDRTVDLGSVMPASNALVPRLWPKAFSADGATAVTLTLTGAFAAETQTSGYGILDNLALVRAPANLFRANADDLEVDFPDPGFETYRGTSHTWAFKDLPTDGTTLYGWGASKTKDGGDFATFYDQGDNSVAYYGMTLQSPPSGVLFVKGNAHSAWCEIEVPSDGEYELSCRAAPRNGNYLGTHMEFVVGDTLADALADDGARVSFGALTTTEDKWKTFRLGRQRLTKGTKVFCLKNVSTASDPGTQFDDFRLVRATEAGPLVLPSGDFEVVNDGAVFESVTFSEGGLYRLAASCASKAASGSDGTPDFSTVGRNPVAFYLARDGVTNWVGCTDAALTTNFCEYAYLLQIPEGGGTWDVGFKGTVAKADASAADRTMLVDSARLYRVETDGFVSGLSEDLEIVAAKGAKLTFDFAGTNAISRLRIGGRSYSGFVSLALRPELLGTLSGRGTLYVKPRGGVFIVR